MFAAISGMIVGFRNNGCYAILETKRGQASVDINTDFPLRLKIGDIVEFDDTNCVVVDGTIIHVVNEKTTITINNWCVKFQQRRQ